MPPQEGIELSESDMNKIMHVSLPISDRSVLMGSDVGGEWAKKMVVGNNITISITADSKEQADHLFAKLSEGGKVKLLIRIILIPEWCPKPFIHLIFKWDDALLGFQPLSLVSGFRNPGI